MTRPVKGSTRPSRPIPPALSTGNDPFFDFKYDDLIDPDDPGFDSEFDSDLDLESSDDDTSDSETESKSTSQTESQSLDVQLRDLTKTLQSELIREPKSTQLILGHEVAQIFRQYQVHGSAARLSAATMEFLEGGDVVVRPAKRKFTVNEYDREVKLTGKRKTVMRKVIERGRLRSNPLPKLDVEKKVDKADVGIGAKRKASCDKGGRERRVKMETHKGFGFTMGSDGLGPRPLTLERLKERGSPVQQRPAGMVASICDDDDAMDIDDPTPKHLQRRINIHQQSPLDRLRFMNMPNVPGLDRQYQLPNTPPKPTSQPPLIRFPYATPPGTNNPLAHDLSLQIKLPKEMYSLTTDEETQALLVANDKTNAEIPFLPLANLQIALPDLPAPHKGPFPDDLKEMIKRIVALHTHAAHKYYAFLVDKYTPPATLHNPNPPQPPVALFQLAISTNLHSKLKNMFTKPLENPRALGPAERSLFADIRGKGHATLNPVELGLVGRVARVDGDSVESWFGDETKKRRAWDALRVWVKMVERVGIEEAKRSGRY